MGIDVQLTDEHGNIEAEVLDPMNRLTHLLAEFGDPSSHCLQYIDPFGDTIFNRLQMDRLLQEWALIEESALDAEDKVQLTDIKALAVRCSDSVHMYMKFVGD